MAHQLGPADDEACGLLGNERVFAGEFGEAAQAVVSVSLHCPGIASAAVDGILDAEWLLNLSRTQASADLQTLYGIGPFSAELILVRGVGMADIFPTNEPRLARAMTALYGTGDPAERLQIAEKWRPYRSWVALLIRRWLEDETGEIARGVPAATISTPEFARHSIQ
ncbi:hypothetical protein ACXR2W_13055 [Leucobacter sp. HY1908]